MEPTKINYYGSNDGECGCSPEMEKCQVATFLENGNHCKCDCHLGGSMPDEDDLIARSRNLFLQTGDPVALVLNAMLTYVAARTAVAVSEKINEHIRRE